MPILPYININPYMNNTHRSRVIVTIILCTGEQDQLGDLLTRMFDETGKPSSLEPLLPSVEPHSLLVELTNAVNYLMNQ